MLEIQGIKLYTAKEVATLCGCAVSTIVRLRREGKLRSTRLARKIYYSEQGVLEYLTGYLAASKKNSEEDRQRGV